MNDFLLYDLLALGWLVICWAGYTYVAKRLSSTEVCLASVMHMYRKEWLLRMMYRDNRMSDMSAIGIFERNASFLGSSTLLIIAGLLTLLGNVDKAIELFGHLPLATAQSGLQLEAKMLLLLVIFIYAFFKFTWSMRQNGFTAVLIGTAPLAGDTSTTDTERKNTADRIARVTSASAYHFNLGIRAYYFALAVIAGIINPFLFAGVTTLVVYVLYRREFKSSVLNNLMWNDTKGDAAPDERA